MAVLRCLPPQVPTEEGEPEDGLLRGEVPPGLHPTAGAASPLLGHPREGHSEQGILQTLLFAQHLATWFHLSQAE